MSKSLQDVRLGGVTHPDSAWRQLAVALLRTASAMLARLARRVDAARAARQRRSPPWSELEFHAEAGAPEGALYVNGEFIGHLPGVTRL
ncbi:hypothetical protein [Ideonella sp. A 288]|uniref:hypothetical protein n=1 Tax=Ideonella sp. A 288 TaxID=1962181 RepID=UPI000B4A95BB|nr:hypothetical protein [Ideonella sp. A 288]